MKVLAFWKVMLESHFFLDYNHPACDLGVAMANDMT